MMEAHQTFWGQFIKYIETYGLAMVVLTITSGLLIGYFSHYILNVRPQKQRLAREKKQKEQEEEEELEEVKEAMNMQPLPCEQKQVGVVKGMINNELIASLRKVPPDNVRNKSADPVPAFHGKPTVAKPSSSETSSDEDDKTVVAQVSGKRRSASLKEEVSSLSDKDLINTLGNLHGKLATAQLRARTRKMQEDMTREERDDEARTKAKQLESIMSLMMQNQEKFGITNEDEIKEQLNMYNF
ncbi:hypothetical protein V3C99_017472 [Haemonchus contortus]